MHRERGRCFIQVEAAVVDRIEGHAQAQRELQRSHPEARPASRSTKVSMRLPPKMTPAQIAEAQRMAREWKRLGAPGKSRSECALDERAAPRASLTLFVSS